MRLCALSLLIALTAGCGGRSTPNNDAGPDGVVVPDAPIPDGPGPVPDVPSLPDVVPDHSLPPDTEPPPPDLPQSTCTQAKAPTTGTTGPKGKSDILFVVDNTAGMGGLQLALQAAIPTLEATLTGSTNPVDFRIGVVTCDVGVSPVSATGCDACGQDGQLQSQPFLSSCQAPASKYLSYNNGTKNYTGTLANAFKCLSSVGELGCGFEQPLQAAAVQLTTNTTFLRPDASLVLVVFANEDDCSAKDKTLFDPNATSLGPLSSFRCFQHGITCDINNPLQPGPRNNCKPIVGGMLQDVSWYANLLQSLKPAGRAAVVVIAGNETPVSVSVSGTSSSLQESCMTPQGSAYPGIRLKALADALGAYGKFHSICGPLDPAMQDVATLALTM